MKNGKYSVLHSHMRGASHVAKGLECEDYSDSYLDDNIAIAVISDGHGDKNCFRSADGAKYACQVAISTVLQIRDYSELKASPDRVITEIEKNIILAWNDLVLRDFQERPITESDLEGLNDDAVAMLREGRRIQKIYGCTLIMICILDDFWFGIQVGDGKCVCVSDNGLYSQPIPWDNVGCVGNRSTSICDSRAFDSFRYAYSTNIPVASFVASDGVDESFDENGLNKCYYSLAAWANAISDEELDTNFTQLLERISNGGSGDDVSISGIVSLQKEIKKPVATSEQVAEKMKEILDTLKEIEGRYIELRDRDKEIYAEITKAEREIEELEKEIEEKKNSISDKKAEKDSVRKNYINVSEQYREISNQFNVAKERKKQVDDYWKGLGVTTTDTSAVEKYEPVEIEDGVADGSDIERVNSEVAKPTEEMTQELKSGATVQGVGNNEPIIPDNTDQSAHQEKNDGDILNKQEKQPDVAGSYKKPGLFGNLFRKG